MDWTKIKTKYFLNTDWKDSQLGALAKLLCLTAHLERLPKQKEMLQQMHYKTLISVQEKLKDDSIELQEVLQKVLEDVSRLNHEKTLNRERQRTYRNKHNNNNALHNGYVTQERREEKNIYIKDKSTNKKKAFKKPSLEEVTEYIKEINAEVNPTAFFSKHEANGWLVGKNPMKDWKATIRYWQSCNNKIAKKGDDSLWNKPHPKESVK